MISLSYHIPLVRVRFKLPIENCHILKQFSEVVKQQNL
jgi:hypothetical protein